MLKQTRNIPMLFWGCLCFSIVLHTAVLLIFYSKPLWIAKFQAVFRRFSPQENVVYSPENHLLDGVFDHLIVISQERKSRFDSPFPSLEKPLMMLDPFRERESADFSFSSYFSSIDENEEPLLLKESSYASSVQPMNFPIVSPLIPQAEHDIASLEVPIGLMSIEHRDENSPPIDFSATNDAAQPLSLHIQHPQSSFSASYGIAEYEQTQIPLPVQKLTKEDGLVSDLPESVEKKQAALDIDSYQLPSWTEEVNWNDLFAVDVRVMPRKEQEGIYFSVTLNPKENASAKVLKQNFHFIVDAGAKAEKHRISSFLRALTRSLGYLSGGQTFNIHIADKQIHSLSEHSLDVSKKTLAQAKEFLEQKTLKKGEGDKGSLFSLLHHIQTSPSDGIDTVVLITDGAFLKERHASDTLKQLLKKTVSSSAILHVATVGNNPHSALLDALAASCGGKVLHSPTHASFPRKFGKLLIDLKIPVATDLSTHLDLKNPNLAISLMGTSCKLPPLFASQPTTFFGVASATSGSFTLKLQGWNGESPVELSYEIDLEKGTQGAISMKPITLRDKAEYELSLFLANGEKKHLDQAIEWLEDAQKRL